MSPIARCFGSLVGLSKAFACDGRGTTAIEYALIATGIGATAAAAIWGVGAKIQSNFYDKLLNLF